MSKELTIRLMLDKSQAKQEAAAFAGDQAKLVKAVQSTEEAAAAATNAATKKVGAEKVKAAAEGLAARTKATKQVLADQVGADASEVASFRAAARDKIAAASQMRDAFGKFTKSRVDGEREFLDASTKGSKGAKAGLLDLTNVGAQTLNMLQSLAGGAIALGTIKSAANAMTGALVAANVEGKAQLEKLIATKEQLREIALMTGNKQGPSDAEVDRHLNIRKASGLTQGEATKFDLEFEGAGAATKGKNLDDKEYAKAKVLIAKFAATAGGGEEGAAVYGKLGGLLMGVQKFQSGEDVAAAEVQFNKILSKGVGENPTLLKQSAQVAGAYLRESGPGVMGDFRELAAVTAVASRINPDTAADTMKSTTRVLRGFGEKWGPLLKKTGVNEKDTYSEAADKLFGHMEKVEKGGRAIDAYLAEEGVDQHGATNLMAMYGSRQMLKDTLVEEGVRPGDEDTKRRGIVPGKRMTGAEARAEVDAKFVRDVTLRNRQRQADLDAERLRAAMPNQYAKELQLEAEVSLEKQGKGLASGAARVEDLGIGRTASAFGLALPDGMGAEELGRKIRIEQEMNRLATAKGFEVPGRPKLNQVDRETGKMVPTPEYTGWLLAGEDTSAYSAIGSERELGQRVKGEPDVLARRMPKKPPVPPGVVAPVKAVAPELGAAVAPEPSIWDADPVLPTDTARNWYQAERNKAGLAADTGPLPDKLERNLHRTARDEGDAEAMGMIEARYRYGVPAPMTEAMRAPLPGAPPRDLAWPTPEAQGAPPMPGVDPAQGAMVVGLLKTLVEQLKPKPMAPNPRRVAARPPQIGRA